MAWYTNVDRHELLADIRRYKAREVTSAVLAEKYGASRPSVFRRDVNTVIIPRYSDGGPPSTLAVARNHYHPIQREPWVPKAAVFDIEATSLTADGYDGQLICGCILPMTENPDEPVQVYARSFEDADDLPVLTRMLEALSQYNIIVGHYIRGFDINFIVTRMMYHGIERGARMKWLEFDTYHASRALAIKTSSKGLAPLCDFFGIDVVKTAVQRTSWSMVRSRDEGEFEEAMDDIVYHCVEDVKANRQLADHLIPLALAMVGRNQFKTSTRLW